MWLNIKISSKVREFFYFIFSCDNLNQLWYITFNKLWIWKFWKTWFLPPPGSLCIMSPKGQFFGINEVICPMYKIPETPFFSKTKGSSSWIFFQIYYIVKKCWQNFRCITLLIKRISPNDTFWMVIYPCCNLSQKFHLKSKIPQLSGRWGRGGGGVSKSKCFQFLILRPSNTWQRCIPFGNTAF